MYGVGFVIGVILFAVIAGVGQLHGERAEKKLERVVWMALAGAFVGIVLVGSIWSVTRSEGGGEVESTLGTPEPTGPAGAKYKGDVKALVLATADAQYEARVRSVPIRRATAGMREGFVGGWRSEYADRSPVSTAEISVYVYEDSATAAKALSLACTSCDESKPLGAIATRSGSGVAGGDPFVLVFAACGNVYMAVRTSGTHESVDKLKYNAGYLIWVTYVAAARRGLTGCV